MSKNKNRGDVINPLNWEKYQEEHEELYSYLKKKGKHQRAERSKDNKSI